MNTGYLLIIDADPRLVLKMDRGSRILYVGKQTGWRVNPAYPSGRAFVLVLAELNKAGEVDLDLTRVRIWLGTDRFEGHADQPQIEFEHQLAVEAGIGPRPGHEIAAALAQCRWAAAGVQGPYRAQTALRRAHEAISPTR